MARCLIIGCGCRGQQLSAALRERDHVVRGTTRRPERLADIEAAGAEAVLADPDRLATLVPALEHVAVTIILLGSAVGEPENVNALHGPRLEALLLKLLDTTIRGVVYEASGSVSPTVLRSGAATVGRVCSTSRIPYSLIDVSGPAPNWLQGALDAVDEVLAPPVS